MSHDTPTDPATDQDLPRYRAFISYRHAEVDSEVAAAVQRGLERFWVPKSARRNGEGTHIAPVFRDKEELPVSARLGDDIEGALRGAEALVVICSPRTSESSWVAREIETFLRWHDRDRVFVVLAEGEPYDVIPERLLYEEREVDDGAGGTRLERAEIEPLACDFRNHARAWRRTELTRLAAGVLEVSFDSLVRRAQRRRMRLMAVALALVTCVAAYTLWSAVQIRENWRQTQINESEALAVQAQELLTAGDRMEAIQVALAALPESSTANDRPFVPAAQIALQDAVQAYTPDGFWRSCYTLKEASRIYATSEGGLQAYVRTDGSVAVSDIVTGRILSSIDTAATVEVAEDADTRHEVTSLSFCGDGLLCSIGYRGILACFDAREGSLRWQMDLGDDWNWENITASADGSTIAVGSHNTSAKDPTVVVQLLDAASGEVSDSYHLSLDEGLGFDDRTHGVRLAFSPDDRYLAVSCSGSVWRIDLQKSETVSAHISERGAHKLSYLEDAIVSISSASSSASLASSVTLDVFSPALEPLWSAKEEPASHFNAQMIPLTNSYFVVGSHTSEDGTKLLLYVVGDKLKFANLATGKLVTTITEHSPIRSCIFNSFVFTLDYDGNLNARSPKSVLEGSAFTMTGPNVAEGEYAQMQWFDNNLYIAAWDGDAQKQRVYRFKSRTRDVPAVEPIDSLEGLTVDSVSFPTKDDPDPLPAILVSEERVCAVDPATFEPRWTRSFEKLGLDHSSGRMPTSDALYVYGTHAKEGQFSIHELSWEDGSTTNTYTFDKETYGWYQVNRLGRASVGGEPMLVVETDTKEIDFFSLATGSPELALRIGPLEQDISDYYILDDTCLVACGQDDRRGFELFSLEDGSPVDGAIEELAIDGDMNIYHSVSFGWNLDRMLVRTTDGILRCLDTRSWETLWRRELPNMQMAAFSVDERSVLAQDSEGTCMLLSAQTGEVLRTSSVKLPAIRGVLYDPSDPQTVGVLCMKQGFSAAETHFALLSLDEDAFGPTTRIYSGISYSKSQGTVLSYDPVVWEWSRQRIYSLDELIALAHETIEGHELTDLERHQYRIAE